MRPLATVFAALTLAAVACGGTADPAAEGPAESVVSNAPEAPTADGAGSERPEGRPAPDFTLALGQGGEFSLSAEQKPVYMVFWAEW